MVFAYVPRRLQRPPVPAHVLEAGGADVRDRFANRLVRLHVVELARQEARNDLDFLGLALGEIDAAALLVELDAFVPLADHFGEQPGDLLVTDGVGIAARARREVTVLERGEDETKRRNRALFLSLHRSLERVGKTFSQHGAGTGGRW